MRPQTTVKILQAILFAVMIAIHLLAYRILEGLDEETVLWSLNDLGYYSFLYPLQDGLLFAQIALLMLWTHFGPGRWFMRWPIIAGLAWALAIVANDNYLLPWFQAPNNRAMQVLVSQMAVLFVGVMTIQLCGFRLRKVEQIEPPTGRFRFSLRSLLVMVLLSGVVIRACQLAYAHVLRQATLPNMTAIVSVAMPLGVAPLLAIWATLRPGRFWLRLPVFVVLAPALGVVGPYVCGHLAEWPGFVMWTGAEGVVVSSSLLIVRACGYRLVRLKYCGVETAADVQPSLNVAGA